jgi:hypothetical protein
MFLAGMRKAYNYQTAHGCVHACRECYEYDTENREHRLPVFRHYLGQLSLQRLLQQQPRQQLPPLLLLQKKLQLAEGQTAAQGAKGPALCVQEHLAQADLADAR